MVVPSGYSPLLHDVLIKYCNENDIPFAILADNARDEEGELIFPPAATKDRVSNVSALFHMTNNIYSHLLCLFCIIIISAGTERRSSDFVSKEVTRLSRGAV